MDTLNEARRGHEGESSPAFCWKNLPRAKLMAIAFMQKKRIQIAAERVCARRVFNKMSKAFVPLTD